MEQKTTIKELPSGTIDIVLREGKLNILQFNTNCEDALPYCQAACCRNRGRYAAVLEEDEKEKYSYMLRVTNKGLVPVVASNSDGTCCYLTPDSKCFVHNDKPKICKQWHCSPGGKGEGIKIRDNGWGLHSMMEAK